MKEIVINTVAAAVGIVVAAFITEGILSIWKKRRATKKEKKNI